MSTPTIYDPLTDDPSVVEQAYDITTSITPGGVAGLFTVFWGVLCGIGFLTTSGVLLGRLWGVAFGTGSTAVFFLTLAGTVAVAVLVVPLTVALVLVWPTAFAEVARD